MQNWFNRDIRQIEETATRLVNCHSLPRVSVTASIRDLHYKIQSKTITTRPPNTDTNIKSLSIRKKDTFSERVLFLPRLHTIFLHRLHGVAHLWQPKDFPMVNSGNGIQIETDHRHFQSINYFSEYTKFFFIDRTIWLVLSIVKDYIKTRNLKHWTWHVKLFSRQAPIGYLLWSSNVAIIFSATAAIQKSHIHFPWIWFRLNVRGEINRSLISVGHRVGRERNWPRMRDRSVPSLERD